MGAQEILHQVNEKDLVKRKVLAIVVEECTSADAPVSAKDVRGKNKTDVVCMTRCLFVTQMMFLGYSKTSIAGFLHRSEQSIKNILESAHQFKIQSWAYRVAEAKITLRVKDIMGDI